MFPVPLASEGFLQIDRGIGPYLGEKNDAVARKMHPPRTIPHKLFFHDFADLYASCSAERYSKPFGPNVLHALNLRFPKRCWDYARQGTLNQAPPATRQAGLLPAGGWGRHWTAHS